ncbi:hypothetical protein jhhlp_007701 [Lomentospora prolificans]|uniref:CTLH domain-containing protein n=1 Tax=Lomentospora prolificans TaxID=41688 RepID=A0A2N3N0B8_9PEZI|nr:hypothetical protein jhhlp_007701 [Lomentospora prolificans]
MSSATTTPINHAFSGHSEQTPNFNRLLVRKSFDQSSCLIFIFSYSLLSIYHLLFAISNGYRPGRNLNSEMNALILDYLTLSGYSRAAANFSSEANLDPHQDNQSILVRQNIQNAIHRGHVHEAIEALNDLDPEILDGDAVLHFSLLRLQLVELIRQCTSSPDGDITPALSFAQTHLAPRAPTRPQFLEDLENTMALIVFPHDKLGPDLLRLLHPNLRREVADNVNKALLQRQADRREAAIRMLIHTRAWAGKTSKDLGKSHSDLGIDLSLDLTGNRSMMTGSNDAMNTS